MSGETLTKRQSKISALVTELLEILNVEVSTPEETTAVTSETTPPTETTAPSSEQDRLMRGIGAQLNGPFKTNPPGTTVEEGKKLDEAREALKAEHRKVERGDIKVRRTDQMEALKKVATATAKVFTDTSNAIADRQRIRADLGQRLLMLVPEGGEAVAGATVVENQALVVTRKSVETKVSTATTLDALNLLGPEVDQLADAVRLLDDKVRDREQRKQAALRAETELGNPADAKPDPLRLLRNAVAAAFPSTPTSDDMVLAGEKAVKDLQTEHAKLEASLVPLRKKRDLGQAQLSEIATTFESKSKNVSATNKNPVTTKIAECQALLKSPLDESKLDTLSSAIWELRDAISTCVRQSYSNKNAVPSLIEYVRLEASKLNKEAFGVPDLDEDVKSLKEDAKGHYDKFLKAIQKGSGAALSASLKPLGDLRDTVGSLREEAGATLVLLMEARDQLLNDIKAPNPSDCATEYVTKLKGVRDQVTKTLAAKTLTQDVVDKAIDEADAFKALLVEAKADAVAAEKVNQAQQQLATTFAGVKGGARGPVQVELERAYNAANARASLAGDDRDQIGAEKLFAALQLRINEVKAEKPVPTTAFTGIQVGGLDVTDEVKGKAGALCGEAVLGKMNPADKTKLCEAIAADGAAIEALLIDGFGGNSKIFSSLVLESGGEGLSELAKAFAGTDAATARAGLLGLVEQGGFAESPRALAAMLRDGVDAAQPDKKAGKRSANAAAIKNLAGRFTGEDELATMRTMLGDCGLGTSPNATASPAIGSLLMNGCDGDPEKLLTFGQSFEGDDKAQKTHRANLKHLVNKAGVGEHPSVLGPLVKKSGADKLKAIGTEYSTDQNAADLKTMLDNGGMSGDTTITAKKHEHPDTLAKVFEDGLDGDAKKLKKFTDAFKNHAGESKEILDAWNEYDDKYKLARQPGTAIKALLDNRFGGKIDLLQKTFSKQVLKIPDPRRKKQAVRFAPQFCTDTASDTTGNLGAGVNKITASIQKRHKPEAFDKNKMGNAGLHSQFPPGTDTGALAQQVLATLGPGVDKNVAHTVTVGNIDVEIGFLNDTTVNHFGPREKVLADDPHPDDAPTFTTAHIDRILESIGEKAAQP